MARKPVFSMALDESDLQELKDAAKRMAIPPSVYARSLLLRALREENAKLNVQEAERARPAAGAG